MPTLRSLMRLRPLRFESLECRITPASYSINDPSSDGAADPSKSDQTLNNTVTLKSALDRANKVGGSMVIDFSGPMDITTSFIYFGGPVTMNGFRQGNAPAVTIHGNIAIKDGGNIHDMHVIGASGAGIYCQNNNKIKDNVVEGSSSYGICAFGGKNKITGNYVGVAPDGSTANANLNGVLLAGAGNILGGTDAADRNVISGNTQDGVFLSASSAKHAATTCVVTGNYIGISADGNTAIPNGSYGVTVQGTSNRIGGMNKGESNVIVAANGGEGGIEVVKGSSTTNGTKIQMNMIGTKTDGMAMFTPAANDPGANIGIYVGSGTQNTIVQRNTIADFKTGVELTGGKLKGTQVVGNQIGVSVDSQSPLRNDDGILLDGASGILIGGSSAANRNTIASNTKDGIVLDGQASENKIYGNYIGTNFADDDLGNGIHGVRVKSGHENFIGVTSKNGHVDTSYANTIAFNGFDQAKKMATDERGHAIQIDGDPANVKNTIRGNKMHDNKALAIDLEDTNHANELPQNDVGQVDANGNQTQLADHDFGPNNLQNYPVLDSVAHGIMTWELNSDQANATYEIDFYTDEKAADLGYGEGKTYLDSKTLHTDGLGHGTVTIPFSAGQLVSATATDSDGNTSTFSIVDSDADGLADKWETAGIDFDMTGNSILSLPGADPMKKDLYIQADVMSGVIGGGISMSNVFNLVTQAFANAPASVGNPDGSAGVNLHINPDGGPRSVGFTQTYNNAWSDFESDKNANFGGGLSSVQKDARKLAYRYTIFANAYADPGDGSIGSSGLAEVTYLKDPKGPIVDGGQHYRTLGGNDFMVTVPQDFWSTATPLNAVTEQDLAGTLMHEFGHTLGLTHGGTDSLKYKPNYYSVMNYSWQMPGALYRRGVLATDYSSSWTLDYSRAALPDIDENATGTFDLGFDASKQVPVARVWQRSGKNNWYAPPASNQLFRLVPMSGAVDRVSASTPFAKTLGLTGKADLNYNVDDGGFNPQLSKLTGAEDWSHLIYNFRESPSYAAGQHGSDSNEFSAINIGPGPLGPQAADIVVAGSDAGSPPRVQIFKPDGTIAFDFAPFAGTFTGGVRVAKGDVDGDHVSDIIAAMGPGGDSIAVFNGVTGSPMFTAQPYGVGFTGGMNVAIGDLNGDGTNEIVVAPASGAGSSVEILSNTNGSVMRTILAYTATTQGGVTVATGDVNGDGKADVITGMATGAKPQIKIFNGPDSKLIKAFTVTSTAFNGVNVAAADLNGDGKAEIIAGSGGGTSAALMPTVNIYDGAKPGTLIESYLVQDPPFLGGVRVGVVKLVDGTYSVLTATGPGQQPHLRRFNGLSLSDDWQTDLFDNTVDGAFVA